jgi:hypothetical protein
MAKRAHHRPPAHTLVVIVTLTTMAEPAADGDRRHPESEEPAPSTHARSGGKALRAAALATAAGGALVAAGLATTGGLLAAVWGGVFLAVADGLLRSLRSSEPRGGN